MGERSNPIRLVVLDRDGTINEDRDDYVKSADEWTPIPGALEAIARLHQAGWHVVVATNQSGLGRGLFDMAALNGVHATLLRALAAVGGRLDGIFYCPHTPDEGCACRKPGAGLLQQIAERYGVSLQGVPCVGDSLRDLQAAVAAGAEPHLVCTGRHADLLGQPLPATFPPGTRVHADLSACVDHWLGR